MSAANNGGPAFPFNELREPSQDVHQQFEGVSARDYFAARAPEPPDDFDWQAGETSTCERRVRWNYFYADMMLAERSKP